MKANRRKVGRW